MRLLKFLVFLLGIGPAAGQSVGTIPELPKISRDDLFAAVEKAQPIVGRTIDGNDIGVLLARYLAPTSTCALQSALRIERSIIRGELNLQSMLVKDKPDQKPTTNDDDPEDESDSDSDKHPEKWLSIRWSITDTTVEGPVTLKEVGIACDIDLSRSSFEGAVRFSDPTFAGQLLGEDSIFKSGVEVQRADFKGNVVFRRAKFIKNFECVSAPMKGGFEADADFRDAAFNRLASFINNRFMGHMDFRYVQFAAGANFSYTHLGSMPAASFNGQFYMAEFGGFGNFRRAHFKQLQFLRSLFRNGADFSAANGESLKLLGVTLVGPLTMDGMRAGLVDFEGWGGSMVVDGDATFRSGRFDKLLLRRMAFKKNVDLQGLSIKQQIDLNTVSFDGDLRFEDGLLPGTQDKTKANGADNEDDDDEDEPKKEIKKEANLVEPKIGVVDVALAKGLYVDRDQFFEPRPWWAFWREERPRLFPDYPKDEESESELRNDRRIWRQFNRAFESAKNIELRNYAEYQISRLEEKSATGFESIGHLASRLFWGYGVRPIRALIWFGLLIFGFALIYWLQIPRLAMSRLDRVRAAVTFSARTAWELKYGYDNSRTPTFRVLTLIESVLAKVIFALFAYALTQTNPLLSELTKKLLP